MKIYCAFYGMPFRFVPGALFFSASRKMSGKKDIATERGGEVPAGKKSVFEKWIKLCLPR